MPALVSKLTDSKMALGLIPAISSLGFYLPQLFIANLSERMRYKKPFVMWIGGLVERLPFLLIALAIWFLGASSPAITLTFFFLLLVMTSFGSGIGTPAWFDIIAKVIPVQRRGFWSGLSHGLGALIGAGGALYFGQVLDRINFPLNFAILFTIAFAMLVISFIGLALNREPPSTVVKESIPLARYHGSVGHDGRGLFYGLWLESLSDRRRYGGATDRGAGLYGGSDESGVGVDWRPFWS